MSQQRALALLVLLAAPEQSWAFSIGLASRPLGGARGTKCVMGGFEQKDMPLAEGARVSLLLQGAVAEDITRICRSAPIGVTGIVYALQDGRLEIIGEGDKEDLQQLVEGISSATAGNSGVVREAWQLPVGGYQSEFPLVALQPKMSASITLTSADAGTIDYISRHVQTEAVFNRGLKLTGKELDGQTLRLECSGSSDRLKSFVRWCYIGPPLARADAVEVCWGK